MRGPRVDRELSAGVGSRNDETRQHNLSTVLTTVHHGGPTARAEITRRTRLNRSTVGALVGELGELGLVFETSPTESSVPGRPSPIVHPNAKVSAFVVNPDLDTLTLGLVGLGGVVHKRVRYELDKRPTPEAMIDLTKRLVTGMREELAESYHVVGAGVAVPGLVRRADGFVRRAPYLDWTNEPIAERLSEALGMPAYAANDAEIAMISECIHGAGRGVNNLVFLEGFGPGVGGAVMVAGVPLRGRDGYAAELGHTAISGSTARCDCGRVGCLEAEVNSQRMRAALGSDSADLEELDAVLAQRSNRAATKEAERQVAVLAEAIGNFISIFNPEMIVLGGYLGTLHAAMSEKLTAMVMAESYAPLCENVRIERAVLRSRLHMVGSAELAFNPVLRDPAGIRMGGEPRTDPTPRAAAAPV